LTPASSVSTRNQDLDHAIDLELMANVFLGSFQDLFPGGQLESHDFVKKHTALLFSKRYLLHQSLAMSALQLFAQDRSRSDIHIRASYHQEEALALAQPHVVSAGEEHSLAMFFFAGYAAVCATAEMMLGHIQQADDPVDMTVHGWELSRGIITVSSSNWSHIRASWAWPVIKKQIEAGSEYVPQPKHIPAYQTVRSLAFGVQPTEDRVICLNAVEQTFRSISLLQQCDDKQLAIKLVTSWPINMDARFNDLVSLRQPVALVIMAYYACMLNLASGLWWVDDWPKTLLRGVVRTLGDEWTEFLQWPLEILSE
jgi:hypothetical protein